MEASKKLHDLEPSAKRRARRQEYVRLVDAGDVVTLARELHDGSRTAAFLADSLKSYNVRGVATWSENETLAVNLSFAKDEVLVSVIDSESMVVTTPGDGTAVMGPAHWRMSATPMLLVEALRRPSTWLSFPAKRVVKVASWSLLVAGDLAPVPSRVSQAFHPFARRPAKEAASEEAVPQVPAFARERLPTRIVSTEPVELNADDLWVIPTGAEHRQSHAPRHERDLLLCIGTLAKLLAEHAPSTKRFASKRLPFNATTIANAVHRERAGLNPKTVAGWLGEGKKLLDRPDDKGTDE